MLNERPRNSPSSSTGAGCRAQRHSSSGVSSADAANAPTVRGSPQPHSGPCTAPRASVPTAATASTDPSRSGRPSAERSGGAGIRRPSHSAASPIGRFTRKTSRQPPRSTISPPSTGPSAEASAATPAIAPITFIRCSGGNAAITSSCEDGTSSAPPAACSTRAATSSGTVGAVAQSTDPAVNAARPARNRRRPPSTSANRPPGTSSAANTIPYALRIHDRPASVAPSNEARTSGNATLTIVASR